ncbi:hypothetical protein HELRODRAFT_191849 [Helobdella robusta]|uniref:Disintegrin domain-containing protein n=1 Tax=Helobdella robusta TaxID=6412 RepID=T1FTC5_HELRO|nr:hypothetical protein HELRODRAFT_191849 [Helobdella robusta]ESO03516.1 hypothetical protein HELRODRAFT_191849 [Helobdella robusta]
MTTNSDLFSSSSSSQLHSSHSYLAFSARLRLLLLLFILVDVLAPSASCQEIRHSRDATASGILRTTFYSKLPAHRSEYLKNIKMKRTHQEDFNKEKFVLRIFFLLSQNFLSEYSEGVPFITKQLEKVLSACNKIFKHLHKNFKLKRMSNFKFNIDYLDSSSSHNFSSNNISSMNDMNNIRSIFSRLIDYSYDNKQLAINFHYLHYIRLVSNESNNEDSKTHDSSSLPDSICTNHRAVGFTNVNNFTNVMQTALDLSRAIAHTIGLQDDSDGCFCAGMHKCIMRPIMMNHHQFNNISWSKCSLKNFQLNMQAKLYECLKVRSTKHIAALSAEAYDELVTVTTAATTTTSASVHAAGDGKDGRRSEFYENLAGENENLSFQTLCGNGILERSEECDCNLRDDDCHLFEPCCDYKHCLLLPHATCQRGACCHNCTLRPSNRICRLKKSSCDVPEFCDGFSEECPEDDHMDNGEKCTMKLKQSANKLQVKHESANAEKSSIFATSTIKFDEDDAGGGVKRLDGLCFKGRCVSRGGQCIRSFGYDYEDRTRSFYERVNVVGNEDGHCGVLATSTTSSSPYLSPLFPPAKTSSALFSSSSIPPSAAFFFPSSSSSSLELNVRNDYVASESFSKCRLKDAWCGRLQCRTSSHASSSTSSLQRLLLMVEDGSQCGMNEVCFQQKCVNVSNFSRGRCPLGSNGLVCSARGACTGRSKCYCHPGYGANDCSRTMDVITQPYEELHHLSPPPSSIFHEFYNKDSDDDDDDDVIESDVANEVMNYKFHIYINHLNSASNTSINDTSSSSNNNNKSLINTTRTWLLFLMAVVISFAALLFLVCVLCYRRRVPQSHSAGTYQKGFYKGGGLKKRQKRNAQALAHVNLPPVEGDVVHAKPLVERIISFGSLPSYKAEKRKKVMREHWNINERGYNLKSSNGIVEMDGTERRSEMKTMIFQSPSSITHAQTLPDPPGRGILRQPGAGPRYKKIVQSRKNVGKDGECIVQSSELNDVVNFISKNMQCDVDHSTQQTKNEVQDCNGIEALEFKIGDCLRNGENVNNSDAAPLSSKPITETECAVLNNDLINAIELAVTDEEHQLDVDEVGLDVDKR